MIVFGLIACNGGRMDSNRTTLPSFTDIQAEAWEKLAEKKIFFGHQSVGNNIIAGIQDLMRENPQINLQIVRTQKAHDIGKGVMAHTTIGKNTEPLTKIEAFASLMEEEFGKQVDIAFMKLCYVDVSPITDVERLFAEYETTLNRLERSCPGVTFVHVTSPLTSLQTGPKAWIKRLIGRPVGGYEDNIHRAAFNDLLRKTYAGKAPIFDLALVESTYPDGRRATFTKDGKEYHYLVGEYTNDGGHLNEKGRKLVAEQILVLLSALSR